MALWWSVRPVRRAARQLGAGANRPAASATCATPLAGRATRALLDAGSRPGRFEENEPGIKVGDEVPANLRYHYNIPLHVQLFNDFVAQTKLMWRALFPGALVASVLGVGAVARLTGRGYFPARGQGRLRRRLIRRASETSRWVYLATLRALVRWNAEARLRAIRAPTLVLAAEFDITTIAEKRRWVARIPDVRLVELPGSRHHSEQDSPERFNREVLAFLRSQAID